MASHTVDDVHGKSHGRPEGRDVLHRRLGEVQRRSQKQHAPEALGMRGREPCRREPTVARPREYRPSVGKTGTLGQKPIQPGGKRQAPTVWRAHLEAMLAQW